MERSTTSLTNLCHLLYFFRTSYPHKVVDPADIVCWRKRFSPQPFRLLQVLFLHRTRPEACDLLAVVPSFWQVGLFLCGRTSCAIPRWICQYGMSPVFSLCTKPLLSLLVLQHFAFPTFWEFEWDNSRYNLMNQTSSTPAQQESAGMRPLQIESCTLWDYNLQFLFPGGWLFPLHVECGTVLCKTVESEFRS